MMYSAATGKFVQWRPSRRLLLGFWPMGETMTASKRDLWRRSNWRVVTPPRLVLFCTMDYLARWMSTATATDISHTPRHPYNTAVVDRYLKHSLDFLLTTEFSPRICARSTRKCWKTHTHTKKKHIQKQAHKQWGIKNITITHEWKAHQVEVYTFHHI